MKGKLANIFSSRSLLYFANAYILLSIFYYWFETTLLNPLAICLAIVFGLHLFAARGNSKLIFPIIFAVVNLYMFLALFSEVREFPTINKEAMIMMTVGILYLGINIASAIVMILNASKPTQVQLEAS